MKKTILNNPLLLVLFLSLPLLYQCDKQSDFSFPDINNIDIEIYNEIKNTCEAYWDLSNMIDDTFEITIDGDEYVVNCDGLLDNELYLFSIRVDENGNWINDGRVIKE